jgi:hypothetical protein
MHRQYSSKGVVCLSVSIDEEERKGAVLAFLQKQNATFPNYLLNVEQEVWQEKFHVKAPPTVFVFDRDGKLAQRFDTEDGRRFTYDDVEKLVKELIRPGPEGAGAGLSPDRMDLDRGSRITGGECDDPEYVARAAAGARGRRAGNGLLGR